MSPAERQKAIREAILHYARMTGSVNNLALIPSGYAPDEVDFALCVTLDPDVYGGLDTLSNVVIGPDGTIYTPGGEYGTF